MQFISEITVDLIESMGSDQRIAHAAIVSTKGKALDPKANVPQAKIEGMINYLMEHRHGTPFEHGCLTLFVHAPILVWREWHRHRIGQSYNEESGRYKVLEPVFYVPPRDRPMIKVENWKPGRPKFLMLDDYFGVKADFDPTDVSLDNRTVEKVRADGLFEDMIEDMKAGYKDEYARYLRQLERKLDPGLARDNLPVGIYSSCWVTLNPRSLMAFLSLRTHDPEAMKVSYPLYEIETAARKVEDIFKQLWPITYAAFCKHGRLGP